MSSGCSAGYMSSTVGQPADAHSRSHGMTQEDVVEAVKLTRDSEGAGSGKWTAASAQTDSDSWKDLYAVLVSSLRTSSKHFESLTVETLALGWLGLSKSHDGLRDDIEGPALQLDRAKIDDLIYYARWATAFDAGPTPQHLAKFLSIPVENIISYNAVSKPMTPAYFIAVDTSQPFINIVVRGTTTWHDALTDLVAHCEPFFQGQAHSGMLGCARSIIAREMATLQKLLDKHVGYRIHCLGHSLGGGVAALLCYLLRNTPEHRAKLSNAKGVMATGYGTPPVMTRELAEQCTPYCRALIHNHDMVPRVSVHSLDKLRTELEAAADQAFASNTTLAFLRDSGVITGSKAVVGEFFRFAASGGAAKYTAAAVSKDPGTQKLVQAGLQLGASFLTAKFRQLHTQALKDTPEPPPAAASGKATGKAVLDSYTATATGPVTGADSSAGNAAAGSVSAAAAAGTQDGHATVQERAAAKDAALQTAADKEQYAEEERAAAVQLHCPGQLLYLKRLSDVGADAAYELITGSQESGSHSGRVIINRSMLQDHYLVHYTAALQRLLVPSGRPAAGTAASMAAQPAAPYTGGSDQQALDLL